MKSLKSWHPEKRKRPNTNQQQINNSSESKTKSTQCPKQVNKARKQVKQIKRKAHAGGERAGPKLPAVAGDAGCATSAGGEWDPASAIDGRLGPFGFGVPSQSPRFVSVFVFCLQFVRFVSSSFSSVFLFSFMPGVYVSLFGLCVVGGWKSGR